jgi:hypothetical protein
MALAADGGWIEWLEKMSGPKLWGVGTEFHLFCIDTQRKLVNCERFFGFKRTDVPFADIKQQLDFRVALYWKYGDRFSDDPTDLRGVQALKLMAMYRYTQSDWLELGFGGGYMPFFGEGFDLFSRGIITPISITIAPIRSGPLDGLTIRAEDSYITNGFSGATFGNTVTRYSTGGEWNTSLAIGYEFRRHKR